MTTRADVSSASNLAGLGNSIETLMTGISNGNASQITSGVISLNASLSGLAAVGAEPLEIESTALPIYSLGSSLLSETSSFLVAGNDMRERIKFQALSKPRPHSTA